MKTYNLDQSGFRLPATLLVVSPLPFIALIVAGLLILVPNRIGLFDTITPDQLDSIKIGWIVFNGLYGLAVMVGMIGLILLNRQLLGMPGRPLGLLAMGAAGLAILGMVAYIGLRVRVLGFTESQLSLAPGYNLANSLSMAAVYAGLLATVLTGLALFASSALKRTGGVVALLSGLHLLVAVVLFNAIPPFVLSLWWVVLGVGLLRRQASSQPR